MIKPNLLAVYNDRLEYDRGVNQYCLRNSVSIVLGFTGIGVQSIRTNSGLVIPLVHGYHVSSELDTGSNRPIQTTKPRQIEAFDAEDCYELTRGRSSVDTKLMDLLFPHEYSPALTAASLACLKAFQALSQDDARQRMTMD